METGSKGLRFIPPSSNRPAWSWESNRETQPDPASGWSEPGAKDVPEQRPPGVGAAPWNPTPTKVFPPSPPPASPSPKRKVLLCAGGRCLCRDTQASGPCRGVSQVEPPVSTQQVHAAMQFLPIQRLPGPRKSLPSQAGMPAWGPVRGTRAGLWLPPGLAGGPRQEGGGQGSEGRVHPNPRGPSGEDRLPAPRPPLAVVLGPMWLAGEASPPC